MTFRKSILLTATAALLSAAPALAAWKLVERGVPSWVAGKSLRVTPAEEWNRSPGKLFGNDRDEVWTLDGPNLNELHFFGGVAPGDTLFKQAASPETPLPQMTGGMQIGDIPEFYARSLRAALGTQNLRVTIAQPAEFAGRAGVRFAFEFSAPGRTLLRRGIAKATIVDGKLYLISFMAPALFLFDRDAPKAEVIMDSAHF